MPKAEGFKDSDDLKSSSFSNLANMTAQGAPVPLIYGKMMVGSKVYPKVCGVFTLDLMVMAQADLALSNRVKMLSWGLRNFGRKLSQLPTTRNTVSIPPTPK